MATRYVSPVSGTWAAKSSSPFGAPRGSRGRMHAGNDLQAANGSTAVAVIGGKVLYVGNNSGYQWNAVVQGDDGNAYRYATHGPISVKVGARVEQGQPVGTIARNHLHFEVIPNSSPVYKQMVANPGQFIPTQWWPGNKPVTVDPAAFFGVGKGMKVAAGEVIGDPTLRAIVPEKPADPFGVSKLQAEMVAEAGIPMPRLRPTRSEEQETVVAESAPTLNAKDRSANISLYDMGALGVEAPRLKSVDEKEISPTPDEPFTPNVGAKDYAAFQADLQAGKVPWEKLPPTWQATLTEKFGERAPMAYAAAVGAPTPAAAPATALQPEAVKPAPAVAAATSVSQGQPPAPVEARTKDDVVVSLPISEPINAVRPELPAAGMPPAAKGPPTSSTNVFSSGQTGVPVQQPAVAAEASSPPLDIRPPAQSAAAPAAVPAPRPRPARPPESAVPPGLAARRAAPVLPTILGTLFRALVPGAASFPGVKGIMQGATLPPGMSVGGTPLANVKGVGPFSNGSSAASWLGQQSWQAPNFTPGSGGSRYSYFTDPSSGTGGYVTSSGQVYTYPLD